MKKLLGQNTMKSKHSYIEKGEAFWASPDGGKWGIQTPDTRKWVYRISSPAHSITLPTFLFFCPAKVILYFYPTNILRLFFAKKPIDFPLATIFMPLLVKNS